MDPATLSLLFQGGASALNFMGAERMNSANQKMSSKQMAWMERMSNTAHQREVQDLRAAGLNPILSAKYGGASTPSPTLPNMVNSAESATRNFSDRGMVQAQLDNLEADTMKKVAERRQAETQAGVNNRMMDKLMEDIYQVQEQTQLTKQSAKSLTYDNVPKAVMAALLTEHPWLEKVRVGGESFRPAIGGISELIKPFNSPVKINKPTTVNDNSRSYQLPRR